MPTLRIHAWGGLGSQLFAVALAQDIHKRFPKRRIRVILHTGGVTHRSPEVLSLFPEWNYEFVEDFKKNSNLQGNSISSSDFDFAARGRIFIKKMLIFSGFTSSCDSNQDVEKIKPWLLSCRGHYSYRTINPNFLSELNGKIHVNLPPFELANSCAIHYRLGDLLILKEKSPISSELLVSEFQRISESYDFDRLIIFSDSPEEAKRKFDLVRGTAVVSLNVSTIQVMAYSTDAEYFIGTSSKISFWISGLRAQVGQKPSLLPDNNFTQFGGLVGSSINLISTYSINA